jgi:hypothetical protein
MNLAQLQRIPGTQRLKSRYQKYRAYGQFVENSPKGVLTAKETGSAKNETARNGVGQSHSDQPVIQSL